MSQRLRPGAGAALIASVAAVLSLSATAGALTILMKAYDLDGQQYTFQEFRDIVICDDYGGWDSDMLLQPDDLTIVVAWPMYDGGGCAAFDFDSGPVVLSITWRTDDTGYTNLILDNGGQGFTESGTFVFNYVAAEDYWRKLDEALLARPDYRASGQFNSHYAQALDLLDSARNAASDGEKGKFGQQALSHILLATETLLADYGIQTARTRTSSSEQLWWGVTIDRVNQYPSVLDSVAALTAETDGHPWVRIVFDEWVPAADYAPMVDYAAGHGIHVMGEILDSSAMAEYSVAQFQARVQEYVDAFPQVEAWEIGNEVNGEWLGPNVVEKIEYAADYVRQADPSDWTVLTLFWQIGTGEADNAIFDWVQANLSGALLANVDVIGNSIYVGTAPLGGAFDEVMIQLHEVFPNHHLMISEIDYWSADTTNSWWWRSEENPTTTVRQEFLRQMYAASLGYEYSLGGGFWWNYYTEMYPQNDLWQELRNLILTCAAELGDLNCDGSINNLDIDPFVLAMTATPPDYPEYYAQYPNCDAFLADCNSDGSINGLDIAPFVALLAG